MNMKQYLMKNLKFTKNEADKMDERIQSLEKKLYNIENKTIDLSALYPVVFKKHKAFIDSFSPNKKLIAVKEIANEIKNHQVLEDLGVKICKYCRHFYHGQCQIDECNPKHKKLPSERFGYYGIHRNYDCTKCDMYGEEDNSCWYGADTGGYCRPTTNVQLKEV